MATVAVGTVTSTGVEAAAITGGEQTPSLRMLPLLQLVHVEASVQAEQAVGHVTHVSVPGYWLPRQAVQAFADRL